MTLHPQEERELAITASRIEYNNNWPACGPWMADVQKTLQTVMEKRGLSQLFVPLKLNDNAKDILFKQAKLNKLFTSIIDIYDELPFRPDIAFDCSWRALEIMMNQHNNVTWKVNAIKASELIHKICYDVIKPICKKELALKKSIGSLMSNIPLPALRYTIARMYYEHEMAVNPQLKFVKDRAKAVLGTQLYEDIATQYKFDGINRPDGSVQRKSALLLGLILEGQDVDVNGHKHKAMKFEDRLDFMINCILYTSRCERFHGDLFSPFKSDRASLTTYIEVYYMLNFSYALIWMVIYRYCEHENIDQFFTIQNLSNCMDESLNRLKILLKEKSC